MALLTLAATVAIPRTNFHGLFGLLAISTFQLLLAFPHFRWLLARFIPLVSSLISLSLLSLALGGEVEAVADMCLRSIVCLLSLCALVSSTPSSFILRALRRLGFPASVVALISLTFRYLFLLMDEASRLERAWRARSAGKEGWTARLKILPKISSDLLLRTVERGERVGWAMLARGFRGEFPVLRTPPEGRWGLTYALLNAIFLTGIVAWAWLWR